MIKGTNDPDERAWLEEQRTRTDHNHASAADTIDVAEMRLVQLVEAGQVDGLNELTTLLKLADLRRKLGDSVYAKSAGPSAHGGGVQVNIVLNGIDGRPPFSDDGPGDILKVG
jgi:hypothetical protein